MVLRSSLFDYSDAYMLVKRNRTVPCTGTVGVPDNRNRKLIFKYSAPLADSINEINNTEIDHAKDIDVVMAMYHLIKYIENYSKTSWSLSQCNRDQPFVNNNGVIIDVPDHPDSVAFKSKQKITGQIENDGKKMFK